MLWLFSFMFIAKKLYAKIIIENNKIKTDGLYGLYG